MSRVQVAVTFMDDSRRVYPLREDESVSPVADFGVPLLRIGRPARIEIPLSNVRSWEFLRRQERLGRDGYPASVAPDPLARPAAPDPVEVDRVVEWAERDAQSVTCQAVLYVNGMAVYRCYLAGFHEIHETAPGATRWTVDS